jgi:gamma-glutamyltranspeptidase/glutathione hydrolase
MQGSTVEMRRTEVVAENGVVAAGHPTVAEVGVDTLRRGGNVVDATIAAAFAAFVVEPAMCGLGGHGRISIHLAGRNATTGIDHFIRAPSRATPDMYQQALRQWIARWGEGSDQTINTAGHLSVGIPGTVAGLCEAHRQYGSLPLRTLLAPAIDLAEAGLVVDWRHALNVNNRANEILRYPAAAAHLMPGGLPPKPQTAYVVGDRLDARDLARTIKRIAEAGPSAFYEGEIAQAIEREMAANGGLLSADDLARFAPSTFDQSRYTYRAHEYVTCGDLIGVEALNLLEQFDLADRDPNGATYRHLMAEALGQAFVDNFAFAGDPLHTPSPLGGLASKRYAEHAARQIGLDNARREIAAGDVWAFDPGVNGASGGSTPAPFEGTTKVCVADRQGNVVSLITSLGSAFGSLVLVPGTGIYLGNAMQWFDPQPGKTNSVGPGRMPLYAAPVMIAFNGQEAVGAFAGSGGYRIPTAILHTFVHVADYGMRLQAALEAPRLHTMGGPVEVDSRVPASVREELEAMGHSLTVFANTPYSSGSGYAAAVWRDAEGYLHAASEPHYGGTAGY